MKPAAQIAAISALTHRQKLIVDLMARGHPDKLTAQLTGLSSEGVAYHVRRIFKRLKVNSRTEASFIFGQWTALQALRERAGDTIRPA